MNDITELDQLRRQVRHLMDRSAVLDCISTHSRGHDRHDADLPMQRRRLHDENDVGPSAELIAHEFETEYS